MKQKLIKALEQFSLIESGKVVTVALSGGADSMSLLYLLNDLKDELGITLKAAHLNHLIRGEEAFRDEEFVTKQCDKLGIELFLKRIDVPKIARENKESVELTARRLRYAFLSEICEGYIATAHTASDNLETVIFNLTRGSGLEGLCGIPPKRDVFIRPLILATRDDVESYCEINNVPFVTDSTNLSDEYTRNLIRHKVVPVLKELNSSVEYSVSKTVSILREDNAFLKAESDNFLKQNLVDNVLLLKNFENLSDAVAKRVIMAFIGNIIGDIGLENHHINEVLRITRQKGKTNLPNNFYAKANKDKLIIGTTNPLKTTQFSVEIEEMELNSQYPAEKVNNLLLNDAIDYDKIVGNIILRTRLPGDKLMLSKNGCTKTLNKWFNEKCVPTEIRDLVPVLADDKGVLWVYNLGVARRCAINRNTKKILKIKTFLKGE